MSAYGITLRAIIANLFGLPRKDDEQPAVSAEATGSRQLIDDQLTVPGYYVASPDPAPAPKSVPTQVTTQVVSSARS
jgi:hypothetical protein